MALDALLRPWSGAAFRHIPADSGVGVLDFQFAGRSPNNRWNYPGEPTLYLAGDRGVALAELARHFAEAHSPEPGRHVVARAVYRLEVVVGRTIDLR